jgi:hypothetical protein
MLPLVEDPTTWMPSEANRFEEEANSLGPLRLPLVLAIYFSITFFVGLLLVSMLSSPFQDDS